MGGELVTIVIPAYNAEQFLREGIESVLNQTYKNLEIICVCDGCTDHTAEILQEYAEKDSRMIVRVEPENHGAAAARNIGMNMANGEWIAFWDADDLYELCAIDEMIKAAVKEQADIVCCYWEEFNEVPDKEAFINNRINKLYCDTYPIINTDNELHHIMQLVENMLGARLVHKSLCMNKEVFFQDIPNANDVYYSKVAAINSNKIVYIDRIFYHHRGYKNRQTLSSERDLKKNYLLEAYDQIYEHIGHKKSNLLLRRSFYNDVISNFNIYLGDPVYDALFDSMRSVYLEKWGMTDPQVAEELSCVNRVFYKNLLCNNRNINLHDIYMQAKVECIRVLSHKGCSIWGTGEIGTALLEEISKTDTNIQHVFDSAPDKWGKKIHGYVVENFNETQADHIIITTLKYYDEIAGMIGNRADNIYNLDEQIWLIPTSME